MQLLCKIKPLFGGLWKKWRLPSSSFFCALRCGTKQNCLFLAFLKNLKKGNFVLRLSPWKKHQQKKQSTPRRRARKNEEDCSLHFILRPPKSGLILHRSCEIYDSGRPPETGQVTRSWLLIGQPPEKGVASMGRAHFSNILQHPGKVVAPLCTILNP